MEVITKPSNANYRVIVRDESDDRSKSFGVYGAEISLDEMYEVLKGYFDNLGTQ